MSESRIAACVAAWHRLLRGELPGGLDALLADDVVFHSPIVFTPQKGKALTRLYLEAAGATFAGPPGPAAGAAGRGADAATGAGVDLSASPFRYVKETFAGPHAILEFETQVDGKYVNGVDIITCDAEGRITEFKVMIRPLQAVNLLHAKMKAMLETMQGGRPPG